MMVGRAQSKDEKLFYLGQLMENYRGTFFRQAMLAEFQLAIHDVAEKGEGLSGEKMTGIYLDLLRRYHGPRVTIDPLYAIEWAYIQHFSTASTCSNMRPRSPPRTTSRKAVARRRRRIGSAISACCAPAARTMATILKNAGLDMASPTPYRTIVASFRTVLDQAEALLV